MKKDKDRQEIFDFADKLRNQKPDYEKELDGFYKRMLREMMAYEKLKSKKL